MLEIRPTCEHCNKPLPNGSDEAMICSFECTYCKDCVDQVLEDVCPNCGGGFEKRPTRPIDCKAGGCVDRYPVSEKVIHKPVIESKFQPIKEHFKKIALNKR
jgi:uncharacterized protein